MADISSSMHILLASAVFWLSIALLFRSRRSGRKRIIAALTLLLALASLGLGGGVAAFARPAHTDPAQCMPRAVAALRQLQAAPEDQRGALASELPRLAQCAGTPLLDGEDLLFLYQGKPGQQIEVGSQTIEPMVSLAGTSLYVWKLHVPHVDQLVLDYWLVVDGVRQADPWSHHVAYGNIRRFQGVHAPEIPELTPQPGNPQGKVDSFPLVSKSLGETRNIWVYLPPGYDATKRYPLLIALDGPMFFKEPFSLPTVLDNLLAEGKIPPIMAINVEVSQTHRHEEYLPDGDRFALHEQFIQDEVLAYVAQHYAVDTHPEQRVLLGVSNSAAAVYKIAADHPESYGGAILLSPAGIPFWTGQPANTERFFIQQGTLEADHANGRSLNSLLASTHRIKFVEVVGSHAQITSARQLPTGLVWIWQP